MALMSGGSFGRFASPQTEAPNRFSMFDVRCSMSEGAFTSNIAHPTSNIVLPARLADAGDAAVEGHVPEDHARDAEPADEAAGAARERAAVLDAHGGGVAGQLLEPLVVAGRLQRLPALGVLRDRSPL